MYNCNDSLKHVKIDWVYINNVQLAYCKMTKVVSSNPAHG
jgi:hypothetical protein